MIAANTITVFAIICVAFVFGTVSGAWLIIRMIKTYKCDDDEEEDEDEEYEDDEEYAPSLGLWG
jgi:hypothetical protein